MYLKVQLAFYNEAQRLLEDIVLNIFIYILFQPSSMPMKAFCLCLLFL